MAQQDACTLLDADHNEVIGMFEQYKAAHDGSRKEVLAAQIAKSLLVHMQIEDEIFYPAYERATRDEAQLKDARKEHNEARDLIHRIDRDRRDARLMLELEDEILHHVNDEREKMFPKARASKDMDLMQLADQLQARKKELMTTVAA